MKYKINDLLLHKKSNKVFVIASQENDIYFLYPTAENPDSKNSMFLNSKDINNFFIKEKLNTDKPVEKLKFWALYNGSKELKLRIELNYDFIDLCLNEIIDICEKGFFEDIKKVQFKKIKDNYKFNRIIKKPRLEIMEIEKLLRYKKYKNFDVLISFTFPSIYYNLDCTDKIEGMQIEYFIYNQYKKKRDYELIFID